MAELNVQPKKRNAVWPWLLIALAIVLAVIYFMRERNDGSGSGNIFRSDSANVSGYDTGRMQNTDSTNNLVPNTTTRP